MMMKSLFLVAAMLVGQISAAGLVTLTNTAQTLTESVIGTDGVQPAWVSVMPESVLFIPPVYSGVQLYVPGHYLLNGTMIHFTCPAKSFCDAFVGVQKDLNRNPDNGDMSAEEVAKWERLDCTIQSRFWNFENKVNDMSLFRRHFSHAQGFTYTPIPNAIRHRFSFFMVKVYSTQQLDACPVPLS